MKKYLAVLSILALAGFAPGPLAIAAQLNSENQQTVDLRFAKSSDSRTFTIEYVGKIQGIPPGTKILRVWMPVPQDSTVQSIRELSFSSPPRLGAETKYGNRVAYWEFGNPPPNEELTMKFICSRKDVQIDFTRIETNRKDPRGAFEVFKRPDALVIVDDEIRRLAKEITAGKKDCVSQARAIYDYVLTKMTYDKSLPGWGQGSTRHACEVGKGNCTDFHALFNSLCRAQGIASGFEIGLYLPYERNKSEPLGGYHCWAFFRIPGQTWVPVDCSEASRNPSRKEFFFGGHTSNRVTLSTGRDLVLEPKQHGAPLNYFLNPYAEADGKPVAADKSWSFKDLN